MFAADGDELPGGDAGFICSWDRASPEEATEDFETMTQGIRQCFADSADFEESAGVRGPVFWVSFPEGHAAGPSLFRIDLDAKSVWMVGARGELPR